MYFSFLFIYILLLLFIKALFASQMDLISVIGGEISSDILELLFFPELCWAEPPPWIMLRIWPGGGGWF